MDLGVALVASSQPAEVVQVSKAALDHPALAAEARTVRAAAAGDHGRDPERSQQPAVLVVVIAAVGQQPVGLLTRATDLPGDGSAAQVLEQRDQLGDVVAVATGQ
jgi:hypothetical protein